MSPRRASPTPPASKINPKRRSGLMARKEHPRYENCDFGDYEFAEWPMAIYPGSSDGGKTPDRDPRRPGVFLQPVVIVNSEEERRQVLGLDEPVPQEAPYK